MQPALLGIDAGTSAVKAVVYDRTGTELFAAQQGYRLATAQPGWAELDMEEVWHALLAVLRSAGAATSGNVRIVALALAAQAGSIVPVDRGGRPLAPMITWLDQRAAPQVAAWHADGTARHIRAVTGWHPHAGLPIATIAWLTHHAPQVAALTHRFLGAHEFLVERLTGRCVTDFSTGAEMLLMDHAAGAWSADLCALAGIEARQLPDLAAAGTVTGTLLPAVSNATGLPADTRVVVGGHDQCCAALGMGVSAPGELMLATGTAWVLTALSSAMPVAQVPEKMEYNWHVMPGLFTLSQLLGGFGATVEWWLHIAAAAHTNNAARFAQLDTWLAQGVPGAHGLGFLPLTGSSQLAGPGSGGFVGLRLDHTPADMTCAICEGAAYEVKWALDKLAAAGLAAGRIWLSGGATHSPRWPGILADVTGLPLYVARGASWPGRGAAMLAGAGSGLCDGLARIIEQWRLPLETVEPNRTNAEVYRRSYAVHRRRAAQLAS